MTTHKMTHTREYLAWKRMKKSCLSKNYPAYKSYGAKGITICPEWIKDFSKFYQEMGPIPENCNGLQLLESEREYNKFTSSWVFKKGGRKPQDKKNSKVKRKASGVKNPKSICLILEKDHLDFIRKQAIARSSEEGVLIEPNQMIREALQKAFPCPKQYDMFGEPKKKG